MPQWTTQQQQAIEAQCGSLLLSAAAGSGKTAVLTQRVIHLLTHPEHPVDADRLLIVTFTNAAAAEMRSRITEKLSLLVEEHPKDPLYRRQQALLEQASISTVHAFCLELLREYYARLDLDPDFRLMEDSVLHNLREEAANEVIEAYYEKADPEFFGIVELLSSPRDDRKLVKTLYNLHEFVLSHPFPETWMEEKLALYDETLEPTESCFGKEILAYSKQALEYACFLNQDAKCSAKEDPALEKAYLPALEQDQTLAEQLSAFVQEDCWDDAFLFLRQMKYATLGRPKGDYDQDLAAQIKKRRELFKKILNTLKEKLFLGSWKDYRRDVTELRPKVKALFSLVSDFSRRFSEKKKERGFLDFSDLEHMALRLLVFQRGGMIFSTPLALELRSHYAEIMVDEYQDTNATQDMLFFSLSQNGQNIFTVGDVKQSIYGFRQAEPKLFLARQDRAKDYDGSYGASRLFLSHNFRSRRNILDGTNFLFEQLMSPSLGGIEYDESQALICGREPEINGPPVCFEILDTANNSKEPAEQQEARYVAGRILGLLTDPNREGDPLRPGDICILLRSPKDLAPLYEAELAKLGIESFSRLSGSYFLSREVMTQLSLLRVIDNPSQDLALLSLLMSPLYGFAPEEVSALRLQYPEQGLYAALLNHAGNGDDHCRLFSEELRHFQHLAASCSAAELITRLYEETGYLFATQRSRGGEERGDNLRLLLEYARRYEAMGSGSLSGFLRFVDRVMERGGDLQQSRNLQAPENAVQIMSIHNSKGLEFPVCIVAGTARKINFQDVNAAACIHSELGFSSIRRNLETMQQFTTIPREAMRLALRQDTIAEELRVLYVAATRARDQLIFTASISSPEKRIAELASQLTADRVLAPYLVRSAASYFDWLVLCFLRHPHGGPLRELAGASTFILDRPGDLNIRILADPEAAAEAAPEEKPEIPPDMDLVQRMQERVSFIYPYDVIVSLPAKVTVTELAKPEGAGFSLKRPRFMTGQGMTPAEKGTALHRYMQFANYAKAAEDPKAELERLFSLGYFSREEKESISLSKLRRFFDSELFHMIQTAAEIRREFAFVMQKDLKELMPLPAHLHQEQITVQGMVDCLFGEGDSWTIVDYKTDWIPDEVAFVDRYRPQLELYRDAVEKSFGKPVTACALYSFSLGKTIWI